ncbi:MAG: hypothetical protein A2854_00690 [Parcubacteria group bacterium RIFCSPHIGHO2_01_FULL_56_18]|nr:MAG: hypothetical protein A2854_00690 [Parcubacteria group bacterium RIFCSPHIGHO2_01_FULL_56_18]
MGLEYVQEEFAGAFHLMVVRLPDGTVEGSAEMVGGVAMAVICTDAVTLWLLVPMQVITYKPMRPLVPLPAVFGVT